MDRYGSIWTETRIASYLLTEYLERLGVEVIFGLCGHTVIALLDALGKSRIKFVSTRHEQVAAHAADGPLGHVGEIQAEVGHRANHRGRRLVLDCLTAMLEQRAVVLECLLQVRGLIGTAKAAPGDEIGARGNHRGRVELQEH